MQTLRAIFRVTNLATSVRIHMNGPMRVRISADNVVWASVLYSLMPMLQGHCDCKNGVCPSSIEERVSGSQSLRGFCGLHAYSHLQGDRERRGACVHRAIPWPHPQKPKYRFCAGF